MLKERLLLYGVGGFVLDFYFILTYTTFAFSIILHYLCDVIRVIFIRLIFIFHIWYQIYAYIKCGKYCTCGFTFIIMQLFIYIYSGNMVDTIYALCYFFILFFFFVLLFIYQTNYLKNFCGCIAWNLLCCYIFL